MALTLKIDNPDIEQQLMQFVKQQKQDLEEVTVDMLQFLLNAFQKREKLKHKKNKFNEFQELSNVSLEKIWNNKEDEVYDRFLG